MKVISIAIPTYNMEQWLNRCFDSVVIPEIIDKVEIIVVNDGSRDRSSEIAHSYADRYPDSVIVIDKENGNYGSCVNRALGIATGKYFRILDADDWFDRNGFIGYVNQLESLTVDVVVTHYVKEFVGRKKNTIYDTSFKCFNQILSINSLQSDDIDFYEDLVMHKLSYRTDLLKSCELRLSEGISYTDTEYVYYPLLKAQNIIFLDILLYRYFIGREGQTVSISSRISHVNDMYIILDRMLSDPCPILRTPPSRRIQMYLLCTFIASYYWSILVIQKLNKENNLSLEKFDERLKKWDDDIYSEVSKVKCLGVTYIKYWRLTKKQLIPTSIYCWLRRLSSKY